MRGRRQAARGKKDPTLIDDLLKCVDPETAGDPCSDEKWVRSRLRSLSEKLGRRACPTTISRLLRDQIGRQDVVKIRQEHGTGVDNGSSRGVAA